MNPGDLRHKIKILTNQKTTNELEETTYKFLPVKTIWAAVIPQTGSLQKQVAETILTNVTHKIIVRYSAGKDITKDMRMGYKNHEFEIKFILNPYFKNETLEIFVQEVLR